MTDIIVAGGGPAGLTAALYAVRAGRSVLVLEEAAPGGQIDLMDPRVPAWLAAFDLTLEAVRAKMEESAEAQAEQEVTNVQSE